MIEVTESKRFNDLIARHGVAITVKTSEFSFCMLADQQYLARSNQT
jgi:hypothetical protein